VVELRLQQEADVSSVGDLLLYSLDELEAIAARKGGMPALVEEKWRKDYNASAPGASSRRHLCHIHSHMRRERSIAYWRSRWSASVRASVTAVIGLSNSVDERHQLQGHSRQRERAGMPVLPRAVPGAILDSGLALLRLNGRTPYR
jgi:hypothetical protein